MNLIPFYFQRANVSLSGMTVGPIVAEYRQRHLRARLGDNEIEFYVVDCRMCV